MVYKVRWEFEWKNDEAVLQDLFASHLSVRKYLRDILFFDGTLSKSRFLY